MCEEKPLEKEDNEVHSIHDDCHICHPESGHREVVDENKEFGDGLQMIQIEPCSALFHTMWRCRLAKSCPSNINQEIARRFLILESTKNRVVSLLLCFLLSIAGLMVHIEIF